MPEMITQGIGKPDSSDPLCRSQLHGRTGGPGSHRFTELAMACWQGLAIEPGSLLANRAPGQNGQARKLLPACVGEILALKLFRIVR